MSEFSSDYPAVLEIEYPVQERNALTTFFRPLTVIPIAIVLSLLSGPAVYADAEHAIAAGSGLVTLPTALMLVFRQKYPRWWFDWNLELVRFSTRVSAYLALLRDEYTSTDEEQAVYLDIAYPDARELNRWLPLVKWFLAIPHYIVLALLVTAAVFAVIIAGLPF